ncbi:MAG: GntR family transcriptional regulator [Porticoccaceae bacterium]|nr:MAG: GntR family transcriptional regulator [Porticoccaceae bacterium]
MAATESRGRRLYLELAERIAHEIRTGRFRVGERLPAERQLAADLAVSRPTVREALIALEVAGFIEVRGGSGVYVTGRPNAAGLGLAEEPPGPFAVLEARLAVEPAVAALAAARIAPEQLAALEEALAEMGRAEAEGKERADQRFHRVVAEAAGNDALTAVVDWLWTLRNASAVSRLFRQRVRESGVHPSREEHRRILEALAARDPLRAQEAMRAHLAGAIAVIQRALGAEERPPAPARRRRGAR